jgi:hypothetical protein
MKGTVEILPNVIKDSMIEKKIWSEECPIKLEDLRLVQLQHYDFFENIRQGELVVHKSKAANVLAIFKELFELKFPIQQLKLIDEYDGDDERSMTDNNSSCFNFRKIAGSSKVSLHGYGLAIDINPVQNPMISFDDDYGSVSVSPREGMKYLNRANNRPGMVEPIVEIFKTHGFDIWGGSWNTPVDYHHFQVQRTLAEVIGTTANDDATD